MSSKVTSKQVADVAQGKAGQQETPLWIVTLVKHGGPKLGVSTDASMGNCLWLRFSHTSDALATLLREHGWHLSNKNRKGWHRPDDAQAHKFMLDQLGVTREGVVRASAPKAATTPAKSSGRGESKDTPAPKQAPATGNQDLAKLPTTELLKRLEVAQARVRAIAKELAARAEMA